MKLIDRARVLREKIEVLAEAMTDEEGLDFVDLFSKWMTEHEYKINDRVRYNDILYRCVQAHTSQSDWSPDVTPALWSRVSVEEWPEWIQPTGSHDSYMTGDKVKHNEKRWASISDYNIWEPGVYGWEEVN